MGAGGTDLLIGGAGRDVLVLGVGAGTDTLVDFQKGQDLIGLIRGLSFNQLRVTEGDFSTTIEIARNGELLASIPSILSSPLTATDFIAI
ncbi:hypothetical protein NDI51_05730 [Microcoleus vaginatus GB1-A3]